MVSKSSKRNRVGIIVGLLVAAAGIAGTVVLRTAGSTSQPTSATVVKAKQDIPAATAITADMLTTGQVPATDRPDGAFSDPASIVGEYPQVPIPKGTTIISADFTGGTTPVQNNGSGTTTTTGPPVLAPSFALADGYVAISMPVDPAVAIGYYIQPHDHVDFIIQSAKGITYGFQDVEILAVGGSLSGSNQGGSTATSSRQDGLIILALPRRQAEELTLMLPVQGSAPPPVSIVRMVLRPKDAYGKGPLSSGADSQFGQKPNDAPVTAATLSSLFG